MEIKLRKHKTKMTGVRLTEHQDKEVKAIAKREGVSVAEVCRALIEAALIEMHNQKPL